MSKNETYSVSMLPQSGLVQRLAAKSRCFRAIEMLRSIEVARENNEATTIYINAERLFAACYAQLPAGLCANRYPFSEQQVEVEDCTDKKKD